MSLVYAKPAPLFHDMLALIHRHPRAAIMTGVLGLSVPWLVENYHKYLSLGIGGLPYNPLGWMISTLFKPFGRETLSVTQYDKDQNQETWLDPEAIPERRGSRPVTGWHFLPHRQINRLPTEEIAAQLDTLFKKHAEANPALVELTTSPHERHVKGMLVRSSIVPHKTAATAWNEIGHVHPPDHSMHVVLSPADCKLVIEHGWGERHPLSGVRGVPMPKEYLLIYAPRNQEELDVLERIIVAAIGFMTNSREVQ
ncbi:hypothetical protein BDZ89DRAFT_988216 [Hymenopellis radicata]|nr:hypothetical protein BDZ89DRAFT_988216 [Hymenopellis radicata]